MHPIVIIPARMASARLPGKPLLPVGDAPMIVQVWRRVAPAGFDTLVACDGDAIKTAVEDAGGIAVLTDPDLPSGSDRIWQALQQYDTAHNYDVIINVQGDMPTLDATILHEVLALLEDDTIDIATAASLITDTEEITDPAVVKAVFEKEGRPAGRPSPEPASWREQEASAGGNQKNIARSFSRTAQGEGPHYHHIGIYAYRRAALERFVNLPPSPNELKEKLEQLRAMDAGMTIGVAVVDTVPLGVDTETTLHKARSWYEQHH